MADLPPWQDKSYYFDNISKALDVYGATYENMILVSDFNTKESEQVFSDFIFEQDLNNIVSFPTCFKSVETPSTIDLFLTNRPNVFKTPLAFQLVYQIFMN